MELRQLQYAIQIAIERNFSRAAEKLHIAQPSLEPTIVQARERTRCALVSTQHEFR